MTKRMRADQKRSSRQADDALNIPFKANRVLNIVLIALILILLRNWHLAVVQYDEKLAESSKPQRKVVTEPAKRGTICDRFNIPLAINKMQYNVAILYSQFKQIPTVSSELGPDGKRVKKYKRREYIAALSSLLAEELGMDADRIADLIHAKAIFYHQIPFVLKEDISENQYYRLKMLEKDWLGICVQRVPRRTYTQGKVAGDIIGYIGPLNQREHELIVREIKELEMHLEAAEAGDLLPLPAHVETIEDVKLRLQELQNLAYTMNDAIGKAGIESKFERMLRGYHGKRSYYSDAKGNFLREFPDRREPQAGKRLMLTLSAELQEFAETLLVQNEQIRQTKLCRLESVKKTIPAEKEPWIKGGAIVALDPNNGEIIAMASHPRFDPNDFIKLENHSERKNNVLNWLESERYIASIWEGKLPLSRELFQKGRGIYLEELPLTWEHYLDFILAVNSPLKKIKSYALEDALQVQRQFDRLLQLTPHKHPLALLNILYHGADQQGYSKELSRELSRCHFEEIKEALLEQHHAEAMEAKRALDRYLGDLTTAYDQLLLIDLMRVAVPADRFTGALQQKKGGQTLASYRAATGAFVMVQEVVKKMARELFHELEFKSWRKQHEKDYLKAERKKEAEAKRYARPYIEILDHLEGQMFQEFWSKEQWKCILALVISFSDQDQRLLPYYDYFHTWHREMVQGAHQNMEWTGAFWQLLGAIQGLDTDSALEYLQTMRSFQELNRPLLGRYKGVRKGKDNRQLEKHLAGAFYPKFGYGYGRSQGYRQAATQGSIFKMVTAYEGLVQRYRQLQAAGSDPDHARFQELNPLEMTDQVYYKGKSLYVGYGSDGTPLPRHYKGGRLPRSISSANGRMDVLKAIEVSSNPYFSLLAGEVIDSPLDLAKTAKEFSYGARTGIDLPGEIPGNIPNDLEHNRTGLYSFAIGQHTLVVTPLQTALMFSALANGGKILKPKLVSMLLGKEQEEASLEEVPLFFTDESGPEIYFAKETATEIRHELFLPEVIRRILIDGMCRVASKTHQSSLTSFKRLYKHYPEAIQDYQEMLPFLPGKTSTAESVEMIDLDQQQGINIYTHVWFGGIVYDQEIMQRQHNQFIFHDSQGNPELVVVVYLRYGGYGKESAPVAAQVAKKWKEIKARHAGL